MKKKQKTIYKIVGREKGKTLAIFCGIHGDESTGITAVKKLIKNISLKKGIIYLVIANEKAIDIKKREYKYNMNRMFGVKTSEKEMLDSYEYKRVKKLERILNESDALLDLHSSGTLDSKPFIIFEKPSKNIAEQINFPIRTSGWHKIHKGSTDEYMFNQNKIAICAECGFHHDPSGPAYADYAITNFLKYFDVALDLDDIDIKIIKSDVEQLNYTVKYNYLTKKNFKLVKEFSDFESVIKKQIIGLDGKNKVYAKHNGRIIFARNRDKKMEQAFVLLVEEKQ